MARFRRLTTALACGAMALGTGCDDSDEPDDAGIRGPWASLATAVDLRPDTPESVVQRYLGQLQAGATARALAQYLPDLRDRVGLRRLALALEQVGASRALGRKELGPVATDPRATRLRVAIFGRADEAARYGFTLIRRDGRWWIVYDDLTRDSFAGWAELKNRSRPAGLRARRQFVRASERALRAAG